MIAAADLNVQSWAGRLPDVEPGEVFWASSRDVPALLAAGLAVTAPPGTAAPQVEPPWTAHGSPGFGAGTSNSSYPAAALLTAMIDGGAASGTTVAVIDGGPAGTWEPQTGLIDGGNA